MRAGHYSVLLNQHRENLSWHLFCGYISLYVLTKQKPMTTDLKTGLTIFYVLSLLMGETAVLLLCFFVLSQSVNLHRQVRPVHVLVMFPQYVCLT